MSQTIGDLPIDRFERLERAILGDDEVGHLGAITRLNQVEHEVIPDIEKRRIDGDRRLHERLDKHITETQREIEEMERHASIHRGNIERKIDRLWWMLLGSTGAGVAIGWGISGAPPLGG